MEKSTKSSGQNATNSFCALETERKWVKRFLVELDLPQSGFAIEEKKVAEVSCNILLAGNHLFESYKNKSEEPSRHALILTTYTESIVNAPLGSEEMAEAYAKRSEVLMTFCNYKGSLEDIDRALEISKSDTLKSKLHCNRVKCLGALNMISRQKIAYNTAKDWLKKADIRANLKRDHIKKLDSLMSTNHERTNERCLQSEVERTLDPHVSDALKIENDHCEKKVIAQRDIRCGEILIVENSFSSYANYTYDGSFLTCAYCMKLTMTGIPCDYCCFVVYCSENCKSDGWRKFHCIECILMNDMDETHDDENEMFGVSLRVFLQTLRDKNMDSLRDSINKVEKNRSQDNKKPKVNDTESTYECFFSHIFSFNFSENVTKKKASKAVKLISSLIKYFPFDENIFKTIKDTKNLAANEDVVFMSALFTRFLLAIPILVDNQLGSFKCKCYKGVASEIHKQVEYSINSLYLLTSSLKHSCNSNTASITNKRQKIVYANYPIKAGEEITQDHGYTYYRFNKFTRKTKLRDMNITCTCTACNEHWPVSSKIPFLKDMDIPEHICRGFSKAIEIHKADFARSLDDQNKQNILTKTITTVSKEIEVLSCLSTEPCKELLEWTECLHDVFMALYDIHNTANIHCENGH